MPKPKSDAVVVIPARYASVRFPGKLIQRDQTGKYLIQHVWEAAMKAKLISRVIVATDDERIYDAVTSFGGEAMMTSPNHICGSDRVAEVAAKLDVPIIVNLQGDEPLIRPEMVDQTVSLLHEDPEAVIATLANEIHSDQELADPNAVKVVLDAQQRALYFSRAPIPYVRGAVSPVAETPARHLKHIGIYAYRREFLLKYTKLDPAPLELAEKLEQLRALYHGYKIRVGITPFRLIGVDTPEDYKAFLAALSEKKAGEYIHPRKARRSKK